MTREARRTHVVVWALLAPAMIGLVIAAWNIGRPSLARASLGKSASPAISKPSNGAQR